MKYNAYSRIRKWPIYILQQIAFPLLSFPVRNISCCENELSDLRNTILNISGLKVKEWKHVYSFSFTFSHLPQCLSYFIYFFVFLSMLLFYLSAINLMLSAQCRIGCGESRVLLHLTSLALSPLGSMPVLFVNTLLVSSFERPRKYSNIA
jgi:hypothetical protein